MKYKEIGGYIEFEENNGYDIHELAISLNCGRNCLAYLIIAKQIKTIYLPVFLCSSVKNICEKYGVKVKYYHINDNLRPIFDFEISQEEYLYIVNYYGQIGNSEIVKWKKQYPNLIIDNAQAYFQHPIEGVDTIYTSRKFFGVSDGAYLYTDKYVDSLFEQDFSYERMKFLLGRYEKGANEFYDLYVENNRGFQYSPILRMSKLTHNILKGINYELVSNTRTSNYKLLDNMLSQYNKLNVNIPQGAFMYPLYICNGNEIRKKLKDKMIYVPVLWNDVFEIEDRSALEDDMVINILPLPVDQRYNDDDMLYIANEIVTIMKELDK